MVIFYIITDYCFFHLASVASTSFPGWSSPEQVFFFHLIMTSWTVSLLLMSAVVAVTVVSSQSPSSIFDFEANDISGETLSLSSLRGKKAYLVVNVACK